MKAKDTPTSVSPALNTWKPDPACVKAARKLIGQRAWLCGGGQLSNGVILVKVLRVEKGHAYLDSGDARLDCVLLCSWHLVPIDPFVLKGLQKVKNGQYYYWVTDTELRLWKQGMFSVRQSEEWVIPRKAA